MVIIIGVLLIIIFYIVQTNKLKSDAKNNSHEDELTMVQVLADNPKLKKNFNLALNFFNSLKNKGIPVRIYKKHFNKMFGSFTEVRGKIDHYTKIEIFIDDNILRTKYYSAITSNSKNFSSIIFEQYKVYTPDEFENNLFYIDFKEYHTTSTSKLNEIIINN